MLIVMAVKAQEFPVASVGRIVVVVVILVMDCEFAEPFAFKLAPAPPADMGKYLKGSIPIGCHSTVAIAQGVGNDLIQLTGPGCRLLSAHRYTLRWFGRQERRYLSFCDAVNGVRTPNHVDPRTNPMVLG